MNIYYKISFVSKLINVKAFAAGPDLETVTEYFEEKYPDLENFVAAYATEEEAAHPQPLVIIGDISEEIFTFEGLEARAQEILAEDDYTFADIIEELDSWNGFADGNRVESMYDLDELYGGMKLSDFLNILTSDFNTGADYFVHTIWGLESVDDREEYYRENFDVSDVYEAALDNFSRISFNDSDLEEILEKIDEIRGEL